MSKVGQVKRDFACQFGPAQKDGVNARKSLTDNGKPSSDGSVGDLDLELPDTGDDPATAERSRRLAAAVEAAGGRATVVRLSGMPMTTLGRYLGGREMRVGALVKLASATGVNVLWLATGQGPMLASGDPAAAAPAAPPGPGLFAQADLDTLVRAYDAAVDLLGKGGRKPTSRRLLQVMLLMYDQVTQPEE